MPARHPIYRHRFAGGWAPDFGLMAEVDTGSALVAIPWLVNAENIQYTLAGGIRKVGGTEKLNASALESGAAVMGLFDYWRLGTGGSPVQKRVIHIGTKIKKDDADGNFTDIFSGKTAGAIPSYAVFGDYLVIMSNAAADVPLFWDQTTAKNLGTNTPPCAFGVTHKNRFWMAGNVAAPSRLYYSQALPSGADGDWNGVGAGLIDVNPGDGDRITGLVSFKDNLWVFKGPYHGSIHRITGSSPTDFSRLDFVFGLGAVNHESIFPFMDDIGFVWADGSVHSLKATAAYGDFHEAALSLPLNVWLREHVRHDRLIYASAVNLVSAGLVVFTLSVDTATTNNTTLLMDYRFLSSEGQVRWSTAPAIKSACLANVVDTSSNARPALFAGGYDGFVRKLDRSARSLDGTTGYTLKATLPFLHYTDPVQKKILGHLGAGIIPRTTDDFTVTWIRDAEASQSTTFSQAGGGDVLAPAPEDEFVLDQSALAGESFLHRFANIEEGGEFRSIQFEVTQGGNRADLEMQTLTAEINPSAVSWEN